MELIDILNGMTPFATLGLLVFLFVQGRNRHADNDDTLKLELVKLVGAAVQNIEQSTEALKALRVVELETQTLVSGTRRELANHHEAHVENHAAVLAAVRAVPAEAADRTDERLAPRFEVVQKLLATATNMIAVLADDVKHQRAQAKPQAAATCGECEAKANTDSAGAGERSADTEQEG